mmetsp:Transcript_26232/g.61730  ORF Transcript_26232/g.61730 Transcript_26232/m.61730 type:complete len:132 (-) Transcript_26232:163-558(-)
MTKGLEGRVQALEKEQDELKELVKSILESARNAGEVSNTWKRKYLEQKLARLAKKREKQNESHAQHLSSLKMVVENAPEAFKLITQNDREATKLIVGLSSVHKVMLMLQFTQKRMRSSQNWRTQRESWTIF